MIFKLIQLLDSNKEPYIGLDTTHLGNISFANEFLLKNNICKLDDILKQRTRDNDQSHITVFNVMECQKNPNLFNLLGKEISDLTLIGIGTINKEEMKTWFIVCESIQLNNIRISENMSLKDFHITLAFNVQDLFHASKGRSSIIYEF